MWFLLACNFLVNLYYYDKICRFLVSSSYNTYYFHIKLNWILKCSEMFPYILIPSNSGFFRVRSISHLLFLVVRMSGITAALQILFIIPLLQDLFVYSHSIWGTGRLDTNWEMLHLLVSLSCSMYTLWDAVQHIVCAVPYSGSWDCIFVMSNLFSYAFL